jgi:hypothetical protein
LTTDANSSPSVTQRLIIENFEIIKSKACWSFNHGSQCSRYCHDGALLRLSAAAVVRAPSRARRAKAIDDLQAFYDIDRLPQARSIRGFSAAFSLLNPSVMMARIRTSSRGCPRASIKRWE